MTINLTVIPLLEGKNKVNSSAAELILGEAEVPGASLEQMETVLWYCVRRHRWVHELVHGLHLPNAISIFLHIAVVLKIVHVQELVLGGIIFERLWNLVKTIANTYHYDILLSHGDLFVRIHDIVVLDDSLKSSLELCLIFIVHSDTHGQLWLSVVQNGEISHSSDETGVLDLSVFSIFSEAARSYRGIALSLC